MSNISNEQHKKELVMRLKRVEGQLRGVQAMIEAGEDCEKVTQQLSAARRALDKAFYNVLACAMQSEAELPAGSKAAVRDRVQQVAALLAKFG